MHTPLIITLFSLLLSWSSLSLSLTIGDQAPQIVGRMIDDSIFALSRSVKKPKVINFFWVQCVPCKKELPLLASKEQQYTGVEFIAVHAETNAATQTNYAMSDIQTFVRSLSHYPNNIVLGSPRLKSLYNIKGFPATVLLSKDNIVEGYLNGFNSSTIEQLNHWLQQQK